MIYKDARNIRPGEIKAFILSPHHPTPPAGVSLHGWMQASRKILRMNCVGKYGKWVLLSAGGEWWRIMGKTQVAGIVYVLS